VSNGFEEVYKAVSNSHFHPLIQEFTLKLHLYE